MRSLCVVLGAVFLLFFGLAILHYQESIKSLCRSGLPQMESWLESPKAGDLELSLRTEPRRLLD